MLSFTDRMCGPPVLRSSTHFSVVYLSKLRKPEKSELGGGGRGGLEALPLNRPPTL
jgi:hypothetical protein